MTSTAVDTWRSLQRSPARGTSDRRREYQRDSADELVAAAGSMALWTEPPDHG